MKKVGEFNGIDVMESPDIEKNTVYIVGSDPFDQNKLRKKQFGKIVIDEFTEVTLPKWYLHPIAWWKFQRMLRKWKKDTKMFQFGSTPPGENKFKDLYEGKWKS